MFGFSLAEAGVIAVVALIVLGPDKLPAVMRGVAKLYRQLGKLRTEFSKAVEEGLGPELASLKPEMSKLSQMKVDFKKPISSILADKAKEAVLKETGLNEAVSNAAGLKDAVLEEGGQKEAGLKEAGLQEAGLQETGLQETSLQETSPNEADLTEAGLSEAALGANAPKPGAASRGPSQTDRGHPPNQASSSGV